MPAWLRATAPTGAVGIDRWPQFIADAQERARDPATQDVIEKSRQPPGPGRDAIRPVYPVETLLGVGAAAAKGATAAARALAGAGLRQAVPESQPPAVSTYLERWKAPTSAVTRHGDTVYVSGLPAFDPDTGEVVDAPVERQAELVLEQMRLCLEAAGSSLEKALKCNVHCTSIGTFAAVNAVYARYFPKDPPTRVFVNVPAWPGRFDIEIDCIAAV